MDRILCLPIGFPKPALDPRSLNEKVDNSVKHISYDGGSGERGRVGAVPWSSGSVGKWPSDPWAPSGLGVWPGLRCGVEVVPLVHR